MSTNNSNNNSSNSSTDSQVSETQVDNPWAKIDEERLGRPFDPHNKMDRLRVLRMEFCPASMINEDGTIHQDYFRSKKLASQWSDLENLVLLKSVMEYGPYGSKDELGMDAWRKIVAKWLPQRTFIEVRFQLAKVFGIQDLSCYEDVKFTCELQIKRELKKNKELAKQYGTWKYGTSMRVLSEDLLAIVEKRKEEEIERQKKIDEMRAAQEAEAEEEEEDEDRKTSDGLKQSKITDGLVLQKQGDMQREKNLKDESKQESDADIEMDQNLDDSSNNNNIVVENNNNESKNDQNEDAMDSDDTGSDNKKEGKGKVDKSGEKKQKSSKKVSKKSSGKKSGKKRRTEEVKNQPKINSMFRKLVVGDSEGSKNEKKNRTDKTGNDGGDPKDDDDIMLVD